MYICIFFLYKAKYLFENLIKKFILLELNLKLNFLI